MKLCALVFLAFALSTARAQTWQVPAAPNCSATPLPAATWGNTGAADLSTTVTLTTNGIPAVVLCPGVVYNLTVTYPQTRRFAVAASQGALASPSTMSCPGRFVNAVGAKAFSQSLRIPCDASGYVYINSASVDATSTKTTTYKKLKLPYMIAPVCPTSSCPNKTFTLKTLTDTLAAAQSFPQALQDLTAQALEGAQNAGGDVLLQMAAPLGLDDELATLTNALQALSTSLNSGSGTIVNPTAFFSAIQNVSKLMGGSTSSGLPGLLTALQTVGSAVSGSGATGASGTMNLPALLASMQAIGKLLNPASSTTTVTVQTLFASGQKVLTSLMTLMPTSGAAPSINIFQLITFVQSVGGLFSQLGAMGAALG